ncbi:heavy-metal-associated domain-containing protein [Chitinimonas koreensis]|uniref:heavy-metal-associated domain-containing protein n=1 Tax=Chitinimonas koreensis TaxID=356302 RepID=UPI00042546A0|nr:cation transporter [Chitinimonas koreensis]QNM96166.1 heavy-metal-associated domain-containing protein [Chitinimonas koreensis]
MEQRFGIEGMSCGGCAASVERALKALPGVESVAVELAEGSARVRFDPGLVDLARIRAAIEDAGYTVTA